MDVVPVETLCAFDNGVGPSTMRQAPRLTLDFARSEAKRDVHLKKVNDDSQRGEVWEK